MKKNKQFSNEGCSVVDDVSTEELLLALKKLSEIQKTRLDDVEQFYEKE